MIRLVIAFGLIALPVHAETLSGPARILDAYVLPNPLVTPGAIDASVTLADICTTTTKKRRHVSAATKARVLAEYNVTNAVTLDMELDHLVPLSIGGSNTAENLWPQFAPDYRVKDRLERELGRQACSAYATLSAESSDAIWRQMQKDVTENWVEACRKYRSC